MRGCIRENVRVCRRECEGVFEGMTEGVRVGVLSSSSIFHAEITTWVEDLIRLCVHRENVHERM